LGLLDGAHGPDHAFPKVRAAPSEGGRPEERTVDKLRVFGECTMSVVLIVLTLAVGFGAMMAVSEQALQFASLN
jgi:hypothetical protein